MNALGFAAIASMETGVPVKDIFGHVGRNRATRARYTAWHLARKAGWSYPEIAAAFNRHHTTIMHGVKRIEAMREAENA